MKLWKIAVLVPYALILGWMVYSWLLLPNAKDLGGVFVGMVFLGFGAYALLTYTAILVIALLLRWIILKRRLK